MAKTIKRVEITHEVDSENNTVCINRRIEGFTEVEVIGILSFERARWLEHALRSDPLPQNLKSEVKPDEQSDSGGA